jgi:hypothetical protein
MLNKKEVEVLYGMAVKVSGPRSCGEVCRDRSCRRTIWFYKTAAGEVSDEGGVRVRFYCIRPPIVVVMLQIKS